MIKKLSKIIPAIQALLYVAFAFLPFLYFEVEHAIYIDRIYCSFLFGQYGFDITGITAAYFSLAYLIILFTNLHSGKRGRVVGSSVSFASLIALYLSVFFVYSAFMPKSVVLLSLSIVVQTVMFVGSLFIILKLPNPRKKTVDDASNVEDSHRLSSKTKTMVALIQSMLAAITLFIPFICIGTMPGPGQHVISYYTLCDCFRDETISILPIAYLALEVNGILFSLFGINKKAKITVTSISFGFIAFIHLFFIVFIIDFTWLSILYSIVAIFIITVMYFASLFMIKKA